MTSKDFILKSIRENTKTIYDKPDLEEIEKNALCFPDKATAFCESMKQVGGKAVLLKEEEQLNDLISSLYPEARRIAAQTGKVETSYGSQTLACATFHPDDCEAAADLNGTDLAIVEGDFGVCENAAVWVRQTVKQRTVYFIAEALVILVRKDALFSNMHEAYRHIHTGDFGFGVFISGPSKTADIEQALVFGAHGAADVTVILT